MPESGLSTSEVAALRKLGRSVDERWVAWAVDMLAPGHDTPSLRILAGESKPFNQFEMVALVDRVFSELGIAIPDSVEDAAVALATERAEQVLRGDVAQMDALQELDHLYVELDYWGELQDFYLLYHARRDLQQTDVQFYWPGGTRENIQEIVVQRYRQWVDEFKKDG